MGYTPGTPDADLGLLRSKTRSWLPSVSLALCPVPGLQWMLNYSGCTEWKWGYRPWAQVPPFVACSHIPNEWGTIIKHDHSHTELTQKAALSQGAALGYENTVCRVTISNRKVTECVHIITSGAEPARGPLQESRVSPEEILCTQQSASCPHLPAYKGTQNPHWLWEGLRETKTLCYKTILSLNHLWRRTVEKGEHTPSGTRDLNLKPSFHIYSY